MDQQITAVIINRKEHKLKVYFNLHFNVNHCDSTDVNYTLYWCLLYFVFYSHLHSEILKYFQIHNFIFYIHGTLSYDKFKIHSLIIN